MEQSSAQSLKQVSLGVPIKAFVHIGPAAGYAQTLQFNERWVSLTGGARRVDFECAQVFDTTVPVEVLLHTTLQPSVQAAVNGVNSAILTLGTTPSKRATPLFGADGALLRFVAKALFDELETKRGLIQREAFSYKVKLRCLEVSRGELIDLQNYRPGRLEVVADDLEGPSVRSAQWLECNQYQEVLEACVAAMHNRVGLGHELNTTVITFEVLQTVGPTLLLSQLTIVELPGLEGAYSVNFPGTQQGVLSVVELVQMLARREKPDYTANILTELLPDIIGGNCLTVAIVSVQSGDPYNEQVLRFMQDLQQVSNYPVANDAHLLGLLQKYRSALPPKGTPHFVGLEGNVQLQERIQKIKQSYDLLVREKNEIHDQLIRSEEERLSVAKENIELKVELSQASSTSRKAKAKVPQVTPDIRAAAALQETDQQLQRALQTNQRLETELASVKANHFKLQKDLGEERRRNDNLSLEFVNLVNSNKALAGDVDTLAEAQPHLPHDMRTLVLEMNRLRERNTELEEGLLHAKAYNERLKTDLINYQIQVGQHYTGQSPAERSAPPSEKPLRSEASQAKSRASSHHGQSERLAKESQLQVGVLKDQLTDLEQRHSELSQAHSKQQLQIEELREKFRSKLMIALEDGQLTEHVVQTARDELLRNFHENESELTKQLHKALARNDEYAAVIRGLRAYSRELKQLAEDWAPLGQPRPAVLTMPPPVLAEDENSVHNTMKQEFLRLRQRNEHLEAELKNIQTRMVLSSPIRSSDRRTPPNSEVAHLKQELARSREEIRKLYAENKELSGLNNSGPGRNYLKALQAENERLKVRMQNGGMGHLIEPTADKSAEARLKHYQELLRQLEKERSELIGRATMAEEQLKNIQELMQQSTLRYQQQIAELQKRIPSRNGKKLPRLPDFRE